MDAPVLNRVDYRTKGFREHAVAQTLPYGDGPPPMIVKPPSYLSHYSVPPFLHLTPSKGPVNGPTYAMKGLHGSKLRSS